MCRQCRLLIREWLIFALIAYLLTFSLKAPWPLIFLIAAAPVLASYGTVTSILEVFGLFVPVALLATVSRSDFALYLPFAVSFFLILSMRSGKKWAVYLSGCFIVPWLWAACFTGVRSWADMVFIASSVVTIIMNIPLLKGKRSLSGNMLIVVRSFTGKTFGAVYAYSRGALKTGGGEIKVKEFIPGKPLDLNEDFESLTVAFPVNCFGMDKKYLTALWKNLPKGRGRPAFILYTSSLYPDSASFIPWLMLRIKGYDVMGRIWSATMPMEWEFIRKRWGSSEKEVLSECGGDFADGWPSGLPLILYPSPLFLLALLV